MRKNSDSYEAKEVIKSLDKAFEERAKRIRDQEQEEREAEEAKLREQAIEEIELIKSAIIEKASYFAEHGVVYAEELEDFHRVIGDDEYSNKCWCIWVPLKAAPNRYTQEWLEKRHWTWIMYANEANAKSKNPSVKYCIKVDPEHLYTFGERVIRFFGRLWESIIDYLFNRENFVEETEEDYEDESEVEDEEPKTGEEGTY